MNDPTACPICGSTDPNGPCGFRIQGSVKLRPHAERDKALRDHIETTQFFDEETGEMYDPDPLPEIPGWGEDDDE